VHVGCSVVDQRARPALRSYCPHVWCDSLLAVRFRPAQTAHIMGDVDVDEDEWKKLNDELSVIRDDAVEVNSFMVKHVNTKWEV
jgi:hypothetical protein